MAEDQGCRFMDLRDFGGVSYCMGCSDSAQDHQPCKPSQSSSATWYHHQPLSKDSSNEIRLVELLPGSYDDDLFCNIIHTNLSSSTNDASLSSKAPPLPFRALSYSWATEDGDARLSEIIYCGTPVRRKLSISLNCANALRRVRHQTLTIRIWVDMICIDQRDNNEKNHQVGLMSQIYSKALQVYIYLGESDTSSERFFKHAKANKPDSPANLEKFYSRRWFSRVWVIQEVAMARSALVICGSERVHWDRLCLDSNEQAG